MGSNENAPWRKSLISSFHGSGRRAGGHSVPPRAATELQTDRQMGARHLEIGILKREEYARKVSSVSKNTPKTSQQQFIMAENAGDSAVTAQSLRAGLRQEGFSVHGQNTSSPIAYCVHNPDVI